MGAFNNPYNNFFIIPNNSYETSIFFHYFIFQFYNLFVHLIMHKMHIQQNKYFKLKLHAEALISSWVNFDKFLTLNL